MAMPDPVKAVMTYLAADSDVAALIAGRVFGGDLPQAQAASMPRACVVVREAGGGLLGSSWEDYGDIRLDVFAYGATPHEAAQLRRAVYKRLKAMTRTVSETVLLHWAKLDGGPIPMFDVDTTWPYVWTSWQVLVNEIVAA